MPIASSLGVRQTSEEVWLAWIKTKMVKGTALGEANPYKGQSTEEIKYPAVVVAVNMCRELMAPGSGYWEADLDIMLMGSPDMGADADTAQAAMVGQMEAMLYGPNPGDTESILAVAREIVAAAPPGFYYSIFGFWIEEQSGQAVEQSWVDMFRLKVHCSPNSGLGPPAP